MTSPIAVIGPGAIGSTVAALVHAAGRPVLLCGRTPRDGVEVRPDDGEPIRMPGPVHTDPAGVEGPLQVVFLAVKDTQNAQAAPWLDRLCDEKTVVCALQNGVEQVERVSAVSRYTDESHVVPAAVWISSEMQPAGWVRLRSEARLVLPDTAAAAIVADALDGTTITVEHDPDFRSAAWRKLLVNAVVGFMVLAGRRTGMFRRADVAALARRYLTECLGVARADGADLGDEVVDEIVGMLAAAPEDLTTSMLTDRQAGRPLEWDIRNGVIRRKAAAHGLPTPISDVIVPLLAAAGDGPG
ncbi:2-dehydropantoate 2-reductase [Mycolicibacterium conceptionense]|uniref:2-dehydropantoate 2-reductase n=1 Tax=Mycolicibacterium conceptionense TaxID=451644 RepID=A0A1A0PYW0_9MYCO|nr:MULTISPECIES: oxidoreductase [Mycolicibacterium]MCW1820456.1 oxidoreductase [Mycolicibacterium senegalense]OBB14404.1 2-dehydropantoate 2-reductase [Mycolicibacterium conceptionense]OBF03102.1 2-dehydropantoate 2-reductase [Mycolicibacterium conceptionense]OBF14792.1 2-dehydropantoate 2-reductase [Mycolicibacterium conceptionense]OBF39537.1 2-dehydropantoate 2-reductase [Mycolicibacterium conceptionense]